MTSRVQIPNGLRKVCLLVAVSAAVSCLEWRVQAYTHPCIPNTLEELATIKANLNQEPWKSGYAALAGASTSQLSWPMEGPFTNVSRTPDVNLTHWKNDMTAVYNLARMWYFTGNKHSRVEIFETCKTINTFSLSSAPSLRPLSHL